MRVIFNSYPYVHFKGINDSIKRIQSQMAQGSAPDSFTPSQGSETIIIENYYENGNSKIGNGENRSAIAEGAVTGVTTGTAIEGTKSAFKTQKTDQGIPKDDDVLTQDAEPDIEPDADIDIESDIDIEPDMEIDPDFEIDIEPDFDIDIDPEIDMGDIIDI